MKLSIVVPVYNVKDYVAKCIKSLLNQDIKKSEYEIIIVNDGSTDESLEIVQKMAQNVSNVCIISQTNKGLSVTRNVGLEKAKGEYVWFVDSDDWIERNCLSKIIECLSNVDILAIGYIETYDDISKNRIRLPYLNVNSGKDLIKTQFIPNAQFYICKRSFLNHYSLRFFSDVFHEDLEFTPRMLYYAKKMNVLGSAVYYFYKRPNSITTTKNPKKSFDLIKIARSLHDFCLNVDKPYKKYYSNLIGLAINNSLYGTFDMTDNLKTEISNCFLDNRDLFKHLINGNILKYNIEGYLFLLFPRKCVSIYSFLQKFNS